MKLKAIEIENFKSYIGKHSFSFDDLGKGLHLISGENLAEPKLGSNGAGKSTFPGDALYWILYGKTIRRLKAKNVRSWNPKRGTTRGALYFKDGDDTVKISRSWSPNKLVIQRGEEEPEDVDRKTLQSIVGVTEEAFGCTTIIGQFSTSFFESDSGTRLQIFTDLLDLGKWVRYSDLAKIKSSQLFKQLDGIEFEIKSSKGQIDTTQDRIEALKEAQLSYDKKIKERVKVLEEEVKKLDDQIQKDQDVRGACKKQLQTTKQVLGEVQVNVTEVLKEFREIDRDFQKVSQTHSQAVGDFNRLKREKVKIERMQVGAVCPSCLQEISSEHVEGCLVEIDKHIKKASKTVDAAQVIMDEHAVIKQEVTEIYTDLQGEEKQKAQDVVKIESKVQLLSNSLRHAEDLKQKYEKEREGLINDDSGFVILLEKEQKTLESFIAKKDRQEQKYVDVSGKAQATKFWITGFKEIRFGIIKNALDSLSISVNNRLGQLGLAEWMITFDMERETTSGGVSKGFQVFIECPYTANSVPWEAWSGGETQRLNMAGMLGLYDFVKGFTGVDFGVCVLDEPTKHLNDGGIDDLLDSVREWVDSNNLCTLFIDHRSLDSGKFDKVLTVIKDDQGSHIKG